MDSKNPYGSNQNYESSASRKMKKSESQHFVQSSIPFGNSNAVENTSNEGIDKTTSGGFSFEKFVAQASMYPAPPMPFNMQGASNPHTFPGKYQHYYPPGSPVQQNQPNSQNPYNYPYQPAPQNFFPPPQANQSKNPQDLKVIEDYIVSLLYKSKVEDSPKSEVQNEEKPQPNVESSETKTQGKLPLHRPRRNSFSNQNQWKKKEMSNVTTPEPETPKPAAPAVPQMQPLSTPINITHLLHQVLNTPSSTSENIRAEEPIPNSPKFSETPSPVQRKMSKNYKNLVLAHPRDFTRLTEESVELYNSLKPLPGEFSKKLNLLGRLQKIALNLWPDCNPQMNLFGSSANNFGIRRSDADVCLMIDDKAGNMQRIVNRLGESLRKKNMKNVKTLPKARVPIVKFQDFKSGIMCDICMNNGLALQNTKLIADYAKIDLRFHQLGYIIKHWAKQRQINEPYQGTLSSYAYLLMVINFLQQRKPPVLPCLQNMNGVDEAPYRVDIEGFDCYYYSKIENLVDFGSANKETVGELLAAFFRLFACEFDWQNWVISPRTGGYLTKTEKNWDSKSVDDLNTRDYFFFALEDPFEVSHNLGRLVDRPNLKLLKNEFLRAYKLICQNEQLSVVCKKYDPALEGGSTFV